MAMHTHATVQDRDTLDSMCHLLDYEQGVGAAATSAAGSRQRRGGAPDPWVMLMNCEHDCGLLAWGASTYREASARQIRADASAAQLRQQRVGHVVLHGRGAQRGRQVQGLVKVPALQQHGAQPDDVLQQRRLARQQPLQQAQHARGRRACAGRQAHA